MNATARFSRVYIGECIDVVCRFRFSAFLSLPHHAHLFRLLAMRLSTMALRLVGKQLLDV